MISYEEFNEIVVDVLDRDISSNKEQNLAISAPLDQSLFIVAGPGSGKTTVMVLKILKFIFVDDVAPNEILATTFTKKAANELMSRILGWGDQIKLHLEKLAWDKFFKYGDEEFFKEYGLEIEDFIKKIKSIDFNLIITGTIDSVAEELLRVYRDPGTNQPVLIEEFIANTAMINVGLFKDDRYLDKHLQEYLAELKGKTEQNGKRPVVDNPSHMADLILNIKNRMFYDEVDLDKLLQSTLPEERGKQLTLKIIGDYIDELKERNIYDFPMLEKEFLDRLNDYKFDDFLDNIKVILVDEYQDTNLLQESIYFKIAESAVANGGNITVVGDDDQSLYRFRGATVDLFTNFKERVKRINVDAKEVNLRTNYRSSDNIIDLCNNFVELDEKYQSARVNNKPKIQSPIAIAENDDIENVAIAKNDDIENVVIAENDDIENVAISKNENIETEDKTDIKSIIDNDNIPVLGMFRNNEQELARDLSKLIGDLSKGKEVKLKVRKILDKEYFESINSQNQDKLMESRKRSAEKAKKAGRISLKLDSENGSLGDMAVLTFSPKESFQGHHMFPLFLKKNLERLKEPISIFNPKGQDFQSIKEVSILCGLILECIDPESKIQKSNTKIPKLALRYMKKWRKIAKEFIDSSPEPHNPISLADFVTRWQLRQAYPSSEKWPKKASLLELTYKLASWIQEFQDDVEGLIYLESITKTISQNGFFNEYSANIYFDSYENEVASIEEAIWNIFIPIATGGVKLEESSFETLPPNRLNIMSIHQSKGLEFPLVIVDVGSRFDKNKISDSNLRFPKKSDNSSNLEDKIRSYSSLGKSDRNSCDRSFDDLTRLYFVAFSRAQEVLLLIGLTKGLEGYKSKDTYLNIPNVALGWNRDNEFKGFDELYLI